MNKLFQNKLIWYGLRLSQIVIAALILSPLAMAQELAPRAYWPAPVGTHVLAMGYERSEGNIVTDPSLPIAGVDSTVNYSVVSYLGTFGFLGRTANFQFNVPYSWGNTAGEIDGTYYSRDLSSLTDARLRMAINLSGAPAMDHGGMQTLRDAPRPIVGTSLTIQMPTGRYDENRLLNEGTNRWSIKPALGVIWPIKPAWLLEFELGGWFFSDNDEFLGQTRDQAPIYTGEFHLIHRIRPGFWASLDLNYYRGGRTTVDGTLRDDKQRNSRMGATIVIPFKKQHAVKFAFSSVVRNAAGGDFETLSATYIFAWQ